MTSVLVIDDSLDNLSALSEILDRAGFDAVLTVEPRRALSLCNEISFDMVLCALFLRESPLQAAPSILTGVDVLSRLIEEHPELKVVVMGDDLDDRTLLTARRVGAKGALLKNDDPEEMLSSIQAVLRVG